MKLKVGSKAPSFALLDQDGKQHTLADYRGKWVVVYFYPKDDTPGCTKEACAIRDTLPKFKKMKAVIFGVSADKVAKHRKFADKYDLSFTLLADEEKKMVKDYGVWGPKKFMGREYMGISRMSFIIDPEGKIVKIYEKVKPAEHADELLLDLKELQKG